MARPLRIEYPGAIYNITCRNKERRGIFRDDQDREKFLEIITIAQKIYNIRIFSYVLMKNHFHIMLQTPLGNLAKFMQFFNISYTSCFNRRYRRSGHLYQGRYKSIVIESDEYLSMVSRYIHLNPVRTKIMAKKTRKEKLNNLIKYKWSSLPGFINKKKMEAFISYEPVLSEYGGVNSKGRNGYKKHIYSDMIGGLELKDKIVEQHILGGEKFAEWLKENILGKLQRYRAKEAIINAIKKETRTSIEEIKKERGTIKQVAMDLLYRLGGLSEREIGKMFGVEFSAVSAARKRLRQKLENNNEIRSLLSRIENNLSRLKT